MSKYYCKVCNRDHAKDGFSIEYCDACHMTHPYNRWKSYFGKVEQKKGKTSVVVEKLIHICGQHYKSYVPYEKLVENYSPEEVLAGVPFGNTLKEAGLADKQQSTKDWSEEQADQIAWARENLK